MMALLTQLISGLSETVQAWQEFRRTDIGYFLYDGEIPTASSSLKPSLVAVDKEFSKLRLRLWKLEDLEKELCKGSPQGVSHLQDSVFESELHASS